MIIYQQDCIVWLRLMTICVGTGSSAPISLNIFSKTGMTQQKEDNDDDKGHDYDRDWVSWPI